MKPALKHSLIALGVLAAIAPVLYFLTITAALKAHYHEDQIVLGGKQVQEAIHDYVEKHGSPPAKLEDLIPEFMKSMPSFPEISKLDYRLSADGHGWTLDIGWPSGKVPLIYRRTNTGLNAEDTNRRIHTENGCYVLKAR
jgi:hypothetical protein